MHLLCENPALKFLVFAHHHIMMNSLAEQLMDDHVPFIRIDGNTLMQDRPVRGLSFCPGSVKLETNVLCSSHV